MKALIVVDMQRDFIDGALGTKEAVAIVPAVIKKIEEINLKGQQQALHSKAKAKEKKYTHITISDEGLETIEWISLDCTNADKSAAWHSDTEIKIDKLGYLIKNGVKTTNFWDASIYCDKRPLRMKIRNICGDETVFMI